MWCRRRVSAAVAAAAFIACCVSLLPWSACAGDDDGLAHFILFSGRDLWRNGVFAYGGLLWAPHGLEADGFMLKTLLSGGAYRYDSGSLGTVYGGELKGQVMPGWHFKRGHFELMAFAGLDVETHKLWPDDPGNSLRGTSYGLALAAQLWDQPTPETMLAADASFSTVGPNYASRIAFGWRAFGQFYVGPETQVYGGDGYRQFRVGAHITSLKTGTDEWSAAVGWAIDTDQRQSPYVRIGLMRRL